MTNNGKAIVLTDGKAGHENQSKAFARALGLDFQLVPVKFKSPFHKMLSYLFDRLGIRTVGLLQGLDEFLHSSTHPLTNSSTIIGTGSGTFYAAKSLARKIPGAKCGGSPSRCRLVSQSDQSLSRDSPRWTP